MDKGLRHRLMWLKFRKRLRQLNLFNKEGNFYCYKETGTPCSCPMCSPEKYSRKVKHKKRQIEEYEDE